MIRTKMIFIPVFLSAVIIFCLPGMLNAQESGTRAMNPDDLRCQLLLQDYLGKNIRVTTADKKKHTGRLIAVDKQNLKIEIKKEVRIIAVNSISKIEFMRSVSNELGKGIGGVFLGIGVLIGGLFIIAFFAGGS